MSSISVSDECVRDKGAGHVSYSFFTQESIENPAEDGLEPGRNDVEGNIIPHAVVVEVVEVDVELKFLLHDLEAVVKGDVE